MQPGWCQPVRQEFMENECEALPGVAYPGVWDNRSTINTKTGYDEWWWLTDRDLCSEAVCWSFLLDRMNDDDWLTETYALRLSVCSSFLLSVHASVHNLHYQTFKHDTLKANEPIGCKLAQVLGGSGGQRSRSQCAKMGCRNPFWLDVSKTSWRIFAKPGRHTLW